MTVHVHFHRRVKDAEDPIAWAKANGFKMDVWYDRQTRNWVAMLVDRAGNQVGESFYTHQKSSAQSITMQGYERDIEEYRDRKAAGSAFKKNGRIKL